MVQQTPPTDPPGAGSGPQVDPWHAVSLLVAGVGFYGLLGWLLDRWLNTRFFVAIGILLGAGLGIYMIYKRFTPAPPGEQ